MSSPFYTENDTIREEYNGTHTDYEYDNTRTADYEYDNTRTTDYEYDDSDSESTEAFAEMAARHGQNNEAGRVLAVEDNTCRNMLVCCFGLPVLFLGLISLIAAILYLNAQRKQSE